MVRDTASRYVLGVLVGTDTSGDGEIEPGGPPRPSASKSASSRRVVIADSNSSA